MSGSPGGCRHCGQPLRGASDEGGGGFCCIGCATAWQILQDGGLDRYYDLRSSLGGDAEPVRASGASFIELDDPDWIAACESPAPGIREVDLLMSGLQCAACVWLVERALSRTPGVQEARVDLTRGRLRVRWGPDTVALSQLGRLLDRLGYRVQAYRGHAREEARRREERTLWLRLGISGAAAGNLMILAVPAWVGEGTTLALEHERFFAWASLLVSLPVVTWAALPFHRAAWHALRMRLLHIDLPLSLGILMIWSGSAVAVLTGAGGMYFDSMAALVFLMLLGRYVMLRGHRRAERAADSLLSLGAATAMRRCGDAWEEVPAEKLKIGDVVRVAPGVALPADGEVVLGTSRLDVRILTGEARPQQVGLGDAVVAGTINLHATLEVRVTAVGESRRIARLARLAQEAASERAPIVRLADRLAGLFVGLTLVLSFGTGLVLALAGSDRWLTSAVAVAVVLCPCALGLATPLALSVAQGAAAARGAMIKGAEAIERLAAVHHIVLDKTGTLTLGEPRVVGWYGYAIWQGHPVADLVAALEAHSSHPLAGALSEAGDPARLDVTDIEEIPGRGIRGVVSGIEVAVGSRIWLGHGDLSEPPPPAPDASHAVVMLAGQVVAGVWLADELQPSADAVVAVLRSRGYALMLLSGDRPAAVADVAKRLGIDRAEGGADPETKLRMLAELRGSGGVAMVGDGVNDAAAMAAADVGIAVRGAAEPAIEAADVYFASGGLAALPDVLQLSRRAMTTIRRNVAFSLLYNVIGAVLAISGFLGPLGAAILMPTSSLTVLLSSLAVGRKSH